VSLTALAQTSTSLSCISWLALTSAMAAMGDTLNKMLLLSSMLRMAKFILLGLKILLGILWCAAVVVMRDMMFGSVKD
jgi:hypothetical protein